MRRALLVVGRGGLHALEERRRELQGVGVALLARGVALDEEPAQARRLLLSGLPGRVEVQEAAETMACPA